LVVKKRKGEAITLYCSACSWSTDLPMAQAAESAVVPCAHCGQALYWHACARCGLRYAGTAEPTCPICDDASLDQLDSEPGADPS
jgi:primosomal protein N'